MAVTSDNAPYVSSEVIGTFAFDEFIQEPAMMPVFFDQRPSSQHREVSGSMSAMGSFQPKTSLAEPSESDPASQFSKEFVHTPYALQTKVARELVDDQRFPFFQEFGTKLGQSAIRTVEELAAAVFNYAFTTTNGTAEDGLALCSSAHLNAQGGNSQANRGTTALSNDAVILTRTLMKAFTGYTGDKIVVNPDAILVANATDNEAVLFEILKSQLRPDAAAGNQANFNQGAYQGFVWLYLTDATNWFMMDRRMMALNLFWYWRVVLEIFGDGDLFTGRRRIGGYFRSSHGAKDWRFIFGHEVAS